jgi:hypothetical protein
MLLFLSQNPQNRQNTFCKESSQPAPFRRQGGCRAAPEMIEVLHCFAGFVIKITHSVTTSPDSS